MKSESCPQVLGELDNGGSMVPLFRGCLFIGNIAKLILLLLMDAKPKSPLTPLY